MMTTPGLQPADVLDNPYDDIDESSFSFVTDPAIKRLMAIVLGVVFIESAACKGHSSIELSKNIADISMSYGDERLKDRERCVEECNRRVS
jgi:hypothetical protein